jgi:hypothetical protein
MEVIRFIWDANPSYDIYLEFSERNLFHRGFTKASPPISAHQTRTRAGF